MERSVTHTTHVWEGEGKKIKSSSLVTWDETCRSQHFSAYFRWKRQTQSNNGSAVRLPESLACCGSPSVAQGCQPPTVILFTHQMLLGFLVIDSLSNAQSPEQLG